MLPGIKSYATCIRFNPHLYAKMNNSTPERPAILDLPYRVVFAIGTVEQVFIYSTECVYPLTVIGNTHYANINDFSWDYLGRKLLAASSDGYISIMTFRDASEQSSGQPSED
jgi:chromatin assembly factor 1 subunit B